jgi:hypothetical protein
MSRTASRHSLQQRTTTTRQMRPGPHVANPGTRANWSARDPFPTEARLVDSHQAAIAGQTRDLAMFNLAIDSKLRGYDVLSLRMEDVVAHGHTVDSVSQADDHLDGRR